MTVVRRPAVAIALAAAALVLSGCSGGFSAGRLDWDHAYGGTTTINGRTSYTGHTETLRDTVPCGASATVHLEAGEVHRGTAHLVLLDADGETALEKVMGPAQDLVAKGTAGRWTLELHLDDFNGRVRIAIRC